MLQWILIKAQNLININNNSSQTICTDIKPVLPVRDTCNSLLICNIWSKPPSHMNLLSLLACLTTYQPLSNLNTPNPCTISNSSPHPTSSVAIPHSQPLVPSTSAIVCWQVTLLRSSNGTTSIPKDKREDPSQVLKWKLGIKLDTSLMISR